jgi:hypothetical protein
MYMRIGMTILLLLALAGAAKAQKVMQIERYGRARTVKIHIGEPITYKLWGDDFWYPGYIVDILVGQNLIALEDRYVNIDSIEALRYHRHLARAAAAGLYIFGASWSGFAFIGTLTDGNPDTRYRWSDAIVTGTSFALGWIIQRFFGKRTIRFGKRNRLRLLDLTIFGPPIVP